MTHSPPIHATLIALCVEGRWRGLLLRGPSGIGKSGTALALIGRGWRLVADDRVIVWRSGGKTWGRAPDALKSLLEVRAVGVMPFPALDYAQICAVVEGIAPGHDLDRIPDQNTTILCDVALPLLRLDLGATSAADRAAAFCGALRL